MKKISLLLALAIILGLFCACGSTASSEAQVSTSAPASTQEPAPEVTISGEPTVPEPAVSEVEAPDDEPASDPFEAMAQEFISYPLAGDNTISMWYYTPPYVDYVDSNSNFNCIDDAEAATGVKLKFVEVGSASASEQFNLMVASGDMTDLIPCREYYTGGLSKAYEEDIIIDINEYVDDNMPNYVGVYNTFSEKTQNEALTDGMMLAFSIIADGTLTQNGLVTRGDWLEELGIEISGELMSLDDFTSLLRQLHDTYQTPYTVYMQDGTMPLEAAFDTKLPLLVPDGFMNFTDSTIFRYGDEITTGWTNDGYREYLQYVLDLMDEGVLYKDFLSLSSDRGDINTAQGSGQIAIWFAAADKIEEIAVYSDDPDISFQALPAVTDDPSQSYVWQEEQSLVTTNTGMSISASCQQPELVCQWMNYFWTTDGYYMANYGVEGESLNFVDGEPTFDWETPLTATGANAPNADMAQELFTMKRFVSFYADHDRLLPTFSDSALDAIELWTLENGTDERYYPSTLESTFTTDENEAIAEYEADLLTYAQETALKFLDGSLELNDDTWNKYVDTINSMGMPEIIAVYQNAYDQYKNGDR